MSCHPPSQIRGACRSRAHRRLEAVDKFMVIEITRAGSQPSLKIPADRFTGTVRIDPLFTPRANRQAAAISVQFEPGARSAWHVHPVGQTLIVTGGIGRLQRLGGPILEIRQGDVVWIPPGVRHWHGATPATGVTQIAFHERLEGELTEWMEQVSHAQDLGTRP
jgi:quercetin dioxygenase-like cupin family protein